MVDFRLATEEDQALMLSSRLEMMRVVNHLPDDYQFDPALVSQTEEAFRSIDQDTVFAMDSGRVIGCATACYHAILPTFTNTSGRRAYILNVYTHQDYRRQGIATRMMNMLVEECRRRSITEIDLDASPVGKPVYEKLGFAPQDHYEYLVLHLT